MNRATDTVATQWRIALTNTPLSSFDPVATIPIVEDLAAPELFATEATYFSITGANVTVMLTSLRWDSSVRPPVLKRVVVGRLVMPIPAAQALTISLYDHLSKSGHPVQQPIDPKQVQ